MSNRKSTPFTNEHFAAFCQSMIGQPYWYGCVVYKCAEDLRARKAAQYPSHYGSDRTSRYRQDIAAKKVCADCVGGCKGYAWTGGGIGVLESIGTGKAFTSKHGANGCPDKSANGMFDYAKSKGMDWGVIKTLPEIVGLALRFDGHVGYYIGNGYAVEWRGFAHGCVKTKVAGRGWTHWYKLPFINYESGGSKLSFFMISFYRKRPSYCPLHRHFTIRALSSQYSSAKTLRVSPPYISIRSGRLSFTASKANP